MISYTFKLIFYQLTHSFNLHFSQKSNYIFKKSKSTSSYHPGANKAVTKFICPFNHFYIYLEYTSHLKFHHLCRNICFYILIKIPLNFNINHIVLNAFKTFCFPQTLTSQLYTSLQIPFLNIFLSMLFLQLHHLSLSFFLNYTILNFSSV